MCVSWPGEIPGSIPPVCPVWTGAKVGEIWRDLIARPVFTPAATADINIHYRPGFVGPVFSAC